MSGHTAGHKQGTEWGRLLRLRDRLYYGGRYREANQLSKEIRYLQTRFAPNPDLVKAEELLDAEYERLVELSECEAGSGLSGEGGSSSGHGAPTEAAAGAALRLLAIDEQIARVCERFTPREGTHGRG